MDRRLGSHRPLTPTPRREGIPCRPDLIQSMGSMLTILTVVHERDIVLNAPNKDPVHGTRTETQAEGHNKREHTDRETVASGSPKAPPEVTSGSNHVGEGAHETVRLETSRGGCS